MHNKPYNNVKAIILQNNKSNHKITTYTINNGVCPFLFYNNDKMVFK